MNSPIFVGINARCRHDNLCPPDKEECLVCEWENEILSLEPPFDVECTDDAATPLYKDKKYTVLAVVKDGRCANGEAAPFLLLESSDGTIFPYGYKIERFCTA